MTNRLFFLCTLFSFVFSPALWAQTVEWDGGGGDSLWANPLNWSNDQVPSFSNDIVLNNQWVTGNYVVSLPGGTAGITVRSIQLLPAEGQWIELLIPSSHLLAPALSVTGAPGILIGSGGRLRNASGAPSGTTLVVSDSLRVLTGGRYIHQTETGHASILARLSRSPETAEGVFQFDVPGPASYTLSVSNRTYGSLTLSAAAAGGAKTYLSSGSNSLLIRGNLTLDSGVNYAMNFSGGSKVRGELTVRGTLNLSSGAAAARMGISGGLNGSGIITETGSANAVIALEGTALQSIRFTGQWRQQVELHLNNAQGAWLRDSLTLSYGLTLLSGRLQTSDTALLVLESGSHLHADSTLFSVFVDGPIHRKGLHPDSAYLFPVGRAGRQRWIRLQQATGDYRIEYFRSNPYLLASQFGEGLTHISAMEFWKVESSLPGPLQARISFELTSSGGVTDLQALRVTRLAGTIWEDAGNSAVTGTAGGSGSVTSGVLPNLPASSHYLTLASSGAAQNPLPDRRIRLEAIDLGVRVKLLAALPGNDWLPVQFEYSTDGIRFFPLHQRLGIGSLQSLSAVDSSRFSGARMYRLLVRQEGGALRSSEVVKLQRSQTDQGIGLSGGSWTPAGPRFSVDVSRSGEYTFKIMGMNGLLLGSQSFALERGRHILTLADKGFPAGIYQIIAVSYWHRSTSLRLIKFR